jgi:hypothetical protein
MAKTEHKSDVDTILSYILIKKIVLPIVRTDAYKLKLVNAAGKVIKEPETDKEHAALTLLDRIVFKLKRLLGTRILNLNNFLYINTLNNDFYNKLIVRGTIKQRAEIKRIAKDVKDIKEKYNLDTDEVIYSLLTEELESEFLGE